MLMRTGAAAAALGIGLLSAPAYGAAAPAAPVTPAAVDAYMHRVMDDTDLPGMSVVVTHGGRIVRAAGYGHDSAGHAVTARTPMRIASVSKSFTAAAVMRLAGAGKIRLDAPVAAQMPEFRTADPRSATITPRQLLNQTSGLADPTIDIGATQRARSLRGYVATLRTARLATAPGAHYAYCNVNYDLSARLVEVASGRSFGTYLRTHVFGPLGMDGSATSDRDVRPALGSVDVFGAWVPRHEPAGFSDDSGAGGVITDAHDMGRWLIAQNGHAPHTLTPAALRAMHTPGPGTGDARYGMGWGRVRDEQGMTRLTHAGNLFTYNAEQGIIPSTGYGVAVMTNGASMNDDAGTAAEGLMALTEGRTVAPGHTNTIEQAVLGVLTVLSLGLGVLGGIRSGRWARRRAGSSWWRVAVRLVPQVLPVAVFAAYPSAISFISNGRYVPWYQLTYFAAPVTIFLGVAALAGLSTLTLRMVRLARIRAKPARTPGNAAGSAAWAESHR